MMTRPPRALYFAIESEPERGTALFVRLPVGAAGSPKSEF